MSRKRIDSKQITLPLPESQSVWKTNGIFSDHYIRTRLKESTFWPKEEEIKTIYGYCRNLWDNVSRFLGQKSNEASTRKELIDKIVEKLGFSYIPNITFPVGHKQEPDYILYTDEATKNSVLDKNTSAQYSSAISLIEAKRFQHPLGTVSKHETPGRFPHRQVRDYLQSATDQSGKPYFNWAILTNGNIWRLYCRNAHPDSYFEFNFGAGIYSLENFSLFITLFRLSAFITDSEGRCPLDYLRDEALQHQTALEDNLRERIFKILTQLANGFYQRTENKINKNELNKLYENCLIFLYRLLFVLYAEGRGLLPVKPYGTTGANINYRDSYSLQRLLPKLKNSLNFASNEFTKLYEDMLELFHLINGDQSSRNEACDVPRYNGGLFDPTKKYALLENWRIGEKTLANVLRRLVSANVPKGIGEQESFDFKETVDYADLEVRQLGSIYEDLLENHLNPKEDGTLELKGDKTERKATGTYYTPDYIVQYIVENTLGPLCKEIEKSPEVQARKENSFARAVLKLKVLDPAMGSGHFLVRATEFLADEIVKHKTTEFQTESVSDTLSREEIISHGKVPVTKGLSQDQEEIAYWRRRVVESCIYGVDLNPLAVELAKLSLWLTCISTKRPLSFLDHHLRPGNSLIGAKLKELGGLPKKKIGPLFASDLPKAVSGAISALNKIIEIESKDISIIKDKETRWQKEVRDRLEPYRDVADLWTSTFFGTKIEETAYQNLARLMVQNPKPRTKEALKLKKKLEPYLSFLEIAKNKMFFHWELEFPEVFFNEDGIPKQNSGFDAVVGNPPYERTKYIVEEQSFYEKRYKTCYGAYDIYVPFIEMSNNLINKFGKFGFITSNKYLVTDYGVKLREFLQKDSFVEQLIDLTECPGSFEEALISPLITITGKQLPEKVKIAILKQNNLELLNKIESIVSDFEDENFTVEFRNFQDLQDEVSRHFNIYVYGEKKSLINKIYSFSNMLSDVAQVRTGIMGFEYWKMDDIIQDSKKLNHNQVKILPPSLIERYSNLWGFKLVDLYKKKYKYPIITFDKAKIDDNTWKLFEAKKIITRGVARHISATFDEEGQGILVASHAIISDRCSNHYILTLLNSRLFNWLHILKFYSARIPEGSLRYPVSFYKQLPIRRIAFVTRKEERKKLAEKLKAKVKTEELDEVLKIVEGYLPKDKKGNFVTEKEKSDVVHDLLAFLSEQMIEINKEKQKLIREFLTWLEKEITKASIESFKNKTKIKKFHEYDLDTLIEVLKQNRILVEVLDFGDKRYKALEKAFDTVMSQLSPLKKKLKVTDELIDQIVYKLYGLTEKEIKIVESH